MLAIGGDPEPGTLLALNAPELVVPIVVFLAIAPVTVSHRELLQPALAATPASS